MRINFMSQSGRKIALSGFISLLISAPGWAASPGGVVSGNTNINVRSQNVNTIATGGALARTSIGVVKSSSGNTNVTVDAANISNIVSGQGQKGCINIGTKGLDPECN
jgi:hypothetical protein